MAAARLSHVHCLELAPSLEFKHGFDQCGPWLVSEVFEAAETATAVFLRTSQAQAWLQ